ncbi:amino acid adenylation domain-containing protein [Actinokineospora sp. G85]|uniref:hybrid non-ribosomal peptide synthetase/type I polyketide synthase n=1 Tax=Actinokineospora sp. G85 TaxID=3406626 RepID=UPI003C7608CA
MTTADQRAQDVAIVGMAGRFPGAGDIDQFWDNLSRGVESIERIDEQDLVDEGIAPELFARDDYVRAAPVLADIDRFDAPFFGFTAREAALLDPQQRLFLECAWHAFEHAGVDPAACGPTGVFAGGNMPAYLMSNLLGGNRIVLDSTIFELQIHNDKDYLATRTAYKLGLTGPAVSVQTACSTSLVAVHEAVQALRTGACELAIAGGVTVRVPHRVGYLYETGLIYSPDGHCRPFSADSAGTVFGNGVGAVVLKRLADAERDGDRVLAVLKGSAVNNDGADKVGYTSPSAAGQQAVVAAALADARVPARSVTAVEAHGTGTPIGDPIEVSALSRAFRDSTDDTGFCALGSVKSNIGHLESAAGVASLIKAVLQLRHRALAPSLHYDRPNPRIDFDTTPFYVNTELTKWPNGRFPRRIGVSSFGIGGTNAHVILEEAPRPADPEPTAGPHLLVLSAASPDALDDVATRLGERLGQRPELRLADVAHTLCSGRGPLRFRRTVLAEDTADAARALSGADPARPRTGDAGTGRAPVVFLFPGQGAQHAGMGAGLHRDQPVFAAAVDECAELLVEHLGQDIRPLLHDPGADPAAVTSTEIAQPALFVTEYALARLLESWGVTADGMVGHSIGEFVAATLAGVFSLPDALGVVAARGKLMRSLPGGSMLSVAADEEQVEPLLPEGVVIAAVNAPGLCVASGPHEPVAALAERLAGQGIGSRPLHTSHAFHSPMMDPIVGEVTEVVRGVALHEPTRPFLSCVTGDWITPEQATDPAYWGAHLRNPVRFGAAVAAAVAAGPAVLVEVGPGNTLTTLSRACFTRAGVRVATVAAMRRPDEGRDDTRALLAAVGDVWLSGGSVDWAALVPGRRALVDLPAYPFRRESHWISPSGASTVGSPTAIGPDGAEAVAESTKASRPVTLMTSYVEPRDDLERQVAGVWEEFFGFAPVGVHDDFFELGGHSLLATQILNRLRERAGRTIELGTLLSGPTVAGVTEALRAVGDEQEDERSLFAVEPEPEHWAEPFPLTEMQQAQWIGRLADFDMGGVAPHLYHEFESATIDIDRLEAAWNKVVDRHGMLRVVVLPDGRQRVLPDVGRYRFPVTDLRGLDQETARERLAAVRDELATEVRRADTWPLWEVRVSLLDGPRVRVHISFDLLVADVSGFYYQILPEWRDFYHEPDHDPAPLRLSFRDYVRAEEKLRGTARYERALDYWRERVKTLPAAPELPTVAAPAARTGFVRRHARLDPRVWGRIKERAGEAGVTPSSALLAAFGVAIGTWSRSQRFTLNFTSVNRLPVHQDVDRLVGEFASFDLLEVDAATPGTFTDLVRQVQQQSWEDFEHRLVSGVRILRERARARGTSTSDAMPIVFTSALGTDVDGKPPQSPVDWLGEQEYFISQTPQVTIDHFLLEFEGNLELAWHAVDALFPDGLMAEMFEAYTEFVVGLAEPGGWTRPPVLDLPPGQLAARERANATGGPLPEGLLTTRLFEHAGSDATALVADGRSLSFAELTGRAVLVAEELAAAGLGRGSVVGVGLPKGWQQVVAVLGVSAAGCVYVPLDPDLPGSRLDWLVEQAGVAAVVTSDALAGVWSARTVLVAEEADWQRAEPGRWHCPAEPDDVAYVIYTSGSTGTPKGVAVTHKAALNTLVDINERFEVTAADRVLGLSSLSFDLSVYDVFGVLGAGAALVLPEAGARRDPARWVALIAEHRVTVWNSVPALMRMLVEHAEVAGAEPIGSLRVAMLSGDWIPLDLPDRLRACVPGARVVSLGGATEAAVWSICYPIGEVSPDWLSIPYGTPLRNQTFHVLNDRLLPSPTWVTGQLFIGGAGVAECYWNDERRTAESFIVHPTTGERLYRTGDLGRYLPDGTIEFLGRDDFQVKIGGFRVELGEIEHAMGRHPAVARAVASAIGPRTQQRLVAHLVLVEGAGEDVLPALREHLAATLPSYMVPADFVVIDELPLSSNGKVDRSQLPEPRRVTTASPAAPGDPVVAALLALAADLLRVEGPGAADNFFELGGDSILGVQLVGRANAEGIAITPQALFESETFAELAASAEVDTDRADDHSEAVALTPHQVWAADTRGWLVLAVPAAFDVEVAERALAVLTDRHAALRLRPSPAEGVARLGAATGHQVAEIDLGALPADARADAVAEIAEELADELDPASGALLKLALVRLGDSARLLWATARGLVDGASSALLRSEFEHVYQRLAADQSVYWDAAAGSAADWNRAMRGAVAHPEGLTGPVSLGAGETRVHRLDAEATRELAAAAAGAYHVDLAEVVVAALSTALARTVPGTGLLVERSTAPTGPTVGRTTDLVALDPVAAPDPAGVLTAVKAGMRVGSAAGRVGPRTAVVAEFVDWDRLPGSGLTTLPADFAGPGGAVVAPPGALGEVAACVVDGGLRVRLRFGADVGSNTADDVAVALGAALADLGEHCQSAASGVYDPTDFPLSGLSADDLAEFLGGLDQ